MGDISRPGIKEDEHKSDVKDDEHKSDVKEDEHKSDVKEDEHKSDVKEDEHKKEEEKSNRKDVDKFDQIVQKNKDSGKHWYHGLKGRWWWGLSEDKARKKLEFRQLPRHKIAIASIIRNEEHNGYLKNFLECCQDLEKYHDIVYIFIEGDSEDNTYDILQEWLKPKKDYILKKIDRQKPHFHKTKSSKRTVYFAELRNILIDLIISIPDVSEVLMIDANYEWKGDLVSSLRNTKADIAAPLAVMHKDHNGRRLFYDIWAFRKNGRQFSHSYPYVAGLGPDKPIKVDSAGGGYLIKRKVLEAKIRYNGDDDCEHVSFCQKARKKGFVVKIDPRVYIRKCGF